MAIFYSNTSTSFYNGNQGFQLILEVTETETNAVYNYSTVAYKLTLTNPGHHWDFWMNDNLYVTLTLGSVNLSQNIYGWYFGHDNYGNSSNVWSKTIFEGTTNVGHDADGTLNLEVYAHVPLSEESSRLNDISLSGSMALTSIQRYFTNTICHVRLRNDGSEIDRETTTFTALCGTDVTIPSSHVKSYTGYTNNGTAYFYNRHELPNKNIGDTFVQPAGDVVFDYLYYANKAYICYFANGGTVSNSGYGVTGDYIYKGTSDNNYFDSVEYGKQTDPYNATTFGLEKTGYTFAGWEIYGPATIIDQDTSYDSTVYTDHNNSNRSTANTSAIYCWLVAKWTPNKIKLTLNPNGGSGGTQYVWFYYGIHRFYSNEACTSEITAISKPSRPGYGLIHYYGDGSSGGEFGERYIATAEYEFAGDLVTDIYKDAILYALWEALATMFVKHDGGFKAGTPYVKTEKGWKRAIGVYVKTSEGWKISVR